MLSDELKNINWALGRLLGKTDSESADLLRRIRHNLDQASEDARAMEENLYPVEKK